MLEQHRPERLPEKLEAGPIGNALGDVVLRQRTRGRGSDAANRSSRRAAASQFYTHGTLAGVAGNHLRGPLRQPDGAGGFGPELITDVPLVETVPGAPLRLGRSRSTSRSARPTRRARRRSTTARVPKKCPKGGFPVKTELIFAESAAANADSGATVTTTYKAPCPKK